MIPIRPILSPSLIENDVSVSYTHLLIALAPAVYAVMSNLWAGGAAIAVLLYFLGKATVIPVLNLDALLYFSSGAYLALHGRRLAEKRDGDKAVSRLLKWAVVLACVLLCIMMFRTTHRYANFLTAVLYGCLLYTSRCV